MRFRLTLLGLAGLVLLPHAAAAQSTRTVACQRADDGRILWDGNPENIARVLRFIPHRYTEGWAFGRCVVAVRSRVCPPGMYGCDPRTWGPPRGLPRPRPACPPGMYGCDPRTWGPPGDQD